MHLKKFSLIATLSLSIFANDATFQKGVSQLENQNFDASYKTFFELFRKDSANPQINYYLGRSAFELGRFQEAIAAFERVIISDPTHHRSRLELARAYLALGMLNEAKAELVEVQKANPPREVAQNIQSLLSAIEQKREKSATAGSISVGASYDTNINSNPGQEALSEYLANTYNANKDDIKAQEDKIKSGSLSESLYVRNIYDIGDEGGFFLDNSLLVYNQNYQNHPKHDILYLSAIPGIGYIHGNSRWLLQAGLDHLDYGHEKLLNSFSITPKYSRDFGDSLIGSLYVKHQKKLYKKDEDKGKDALLNEGGVELQKALGKNFVSLSFGYGKEGASRDNGDKFVKKDILNAKISYLREILDQTTILAQYNGKFSNYDDTYKPNSDEKREDWYNSLLLNLTYQIARNYSVGGGYNYIKNSSDYTPGDYDKSIFLLNFSYNF